VKIVTFNVRCAWNTDGKNSFVFRRKNIFKKINTEKPDVVAFQEVTDKILDSLKKGLPEYVFLGHGRNADFKGEGVYTAVKRTTVDILGVDTFWISENIRASGSRLKEQSICPRTCVYSLLRYNNKIFRVFNLHLDHPKNSSELRKKEMEIVLKQMDFYENNGFITFVLGDFNDVPDSECVKLLEKKGYIDCTKNSGFTFHQFCGNEFSHGEKIDYIFADKKTSQKCKTVKKWTDRNKNGFLSDHFPVCAEFKM